MPTFSNVMDLHNYVKQQTLIVMKENVMNKVYEILLKYTMEVYEMYDAQYYQKTYETIDSITIGNINKIGNDEFQIEVYFDSDKIKPYERDGFWNSHMSSDRRNENVSKNIPFYLEYGTEGSMWDRKEGKMVENTMNEIIQGQKIRKELKIALESKGFKVIYSK